MQESYLRKFNFLKGRIEVIYNGFDPERIGSGNNSLFTEFTILHLGNFYAKHKTRNPDLFLTALREMISEQEILPGQLRVFFIGERYPEIERAIVGKGLSAFVSYIDRVPHDIAMEYLNKSHMLLLIETMDVMTTKVFEYLATGKPILALIGNKELKSLIERYSCNSYVILEPSLQTIKRDVSHCYRNYSANKPELLDDFRQGFSREVQTAILAGKLEKIANVERE
jgi:glycosyltransferase involved in cell wall biosynthesis